mmetsp:Transcript_16007/g.25828  ORF Transcript_16007/g.25828 Transcript_16007/m.25828 type:complete len:205 (+) Transcript_16007:306-920(+)
MDVLRLTHCASHIKVYVARLTHCASHTAPHTLQLTQRAPHTAPHTTRLTHRALYTASHTAFYTMRLHHCASPDSARIRACGCALPCRVNSPPGHLKHDFVGFEKRGRPRGIVPRRHCPRPGCRLYPVPLQRLPQLLLLVSDERGSHGAAEGDGGDGALGNVDDGDVGRGGLGRIRRLGEARRGQEERHLVCVTLAAAATAAASA